MVQIHSPRPLFAYSANVRLIFLLKIAPPRYGSNFDNTN